MTAGVLVIGIGHPDRGDDAAGRLVARRLAGALDPAASLVELDGGMVELMDAWSGHANVVVVDAVRSGAPPGTLVRHEVGRTRLPLASDPSTHGLGLAEAIELARALGRLPRRLVVHGIEGARYDLGAPLTPEVEANLGALADRVALEVRSLLAERADA